MVWGPSGVCSGYVVPVGMLRVLTGFALVILLVTEPPGRQVPEVDRVGSLSRLHLVHVTRVTEVRVPVVTRREDDLRFRRPDYENTFPRYA